MISLTASAEQFILGIPSYRFDKKYLDEIYQDELDLGVKFHLNCEIGRDVTLQELQEKYDRVIVNIGAQVEKIWSCQAMAVKRDCHCCII